MEQAAAAAMNVCDNQTNDLAYTDAYNIAHHVTSQLVRSYIVHSNCLFFEQTQKGSYSSVISTAAAVDASMQKASMRHTHTPCHNGHRFPAQQIPSAALHVHSIPLTEEQSRTFIQLPMF